ncbi:MAG TPA: BON domain-containing protein [Nitrospiraceae bacterium]|nr:BON domain-containing protein [Nitrospiraceae bacterium]
MRPALSTLAYVAIAASLIGCGMNAGKSRTSSTDTERRATAQRMAAPDDTRMRTIDQSRVSSSPEDAATASAVRGRIGEDQAINPRRLSVDADRGTVYLRGSVDSSDQKMRAEQIAMQTTGVSSVVNDLRVQPAGEAVRTANNGRSCKLVWKNPAIRTDSAFDIVELRVYDDIGSPLYDDPRGRTSSNRPYDERRRIGDEPRTATSEEASVVGQPSIERGLDRVGRTGGTMQNSGSAQQGGTFQQEGREPVDLNADPRVRTYDDELMARTRSEESRLASRGNLIWNGVLRPGQELDITGSPGPIRYEYRFRADDRFHGNKGAWCSDGHRIAVP